MENFPKDKKIVLFDGVCNLCEASIQFIIKHDKNDIFRFIAIQSDLGKEILNYIKIDTSKIDSIILYEPGIAYYYKAEAALRIAKNLGGLLTLVSVFRFLPNSITNLVYDFVAKNRYKWYGKKEECLIPTPDLKAKFL